jgi:methyl-accepting chemotaxis protein
MAGWRGYGAVENITIKRVGICAMKNLKVSLKLLLGFGVSAVFILTVGIVGVFSLSGLNRDYSGSIDAHGAPLVHTGHILAAIHSLRAEVRDCILFTGNRDSVREIRGKIDGLFKNLEESVGVLNGSVEGSEIKGLLVGAMEKYHKVLRPSIYKIVDGAEKGVPAAELLSELVNVANPAVDLIAADMKKSMGLKTEALHNSQKKGESMSKAAIITMIILIFVCLAASAFLGFYISASISKPLNAAVGMIQEMGHGHLGMRLKLDRGDEVGVMAKTMDRFADDLQNMLICTLKQIAAGDLSVPAGTKDDRDEIGGNLRKTMDSLKTVVEAMKKISVGDLSVKIEPKGARDEISEALKRTVCTLQKLIIDDGGRVLSAAAGNDLSQRLEGEYSGEFAKMKDNINTVMQNLGDALSHVTLIVAQVTSASAEISNGAQSLAEGSSEQASSLEEVSASLEEISSMTKQNADNSNQAKILAYEARGAANEGDATMRRMAVAINQIKQSADNTAKIIKSIDDIAFQTNLLALNAAVEAARAGEAGKGFAVVAEEVRNLAMRSADAAKDTAKMIDESVKNADGGVKITEEVAKSLGQIVSRTSKVGDLIAEIAAASNEQSQGIEQVNIAVAQMNEVTQRNAANAEESASASEELSNQALELAEEVRTFKLKGKNAQSRHVSHEGGWRGLPSLAPAKPAAVAVAIPGKRALASPVSHLPSVVAAERPGTDGSFAHGVEGGTRFTDQGGRRNMSPPVPPATKSARAIKPEEIIPLDDDDLGEF